jgi:hypothetical protein
MFISYTLCKELKITRNVMTIFALSPRKIKTEKYQVSIKKRKA